MNNCITCGKKLNYKTATISDYCKKCDPALKCCDCGKAIYRGATRCRKCADKFRTKTELHLCIDCKEKLVKGLRCRACNNKYNNGFNKRDKKGKNNPNYKNAKIEVHCANCGTKVLKYKNYLKHGTKDICCSKKCKKEYGHKKKLLRYKYNRSQVLCNTVGCNNLRNINSKSGLCMSCAKKQFWAKIPKKLVLIEKYCKICRLPILVKAKDCALKVDFYCSKECGRIGATNKNIKHSLAKRIWLNCTTCGTPLLLPNSRKLCNNYCSPTCSKIGHIKHLSGENSPHFIKDLQRYYPIVFTGQLRRYIRDRDNHKCQLCGKLEQNNCRKLDVHHIDYDKQNCDEDNLISLCINCHVSTNHNRNYWQYYFKKLCIIRFTCNN